jgi:uncharacterized peroxidase-related enzyme
MSGLDATAPRRPHPRTEADGRETKEPPAPRIDVLPEGRAPREVADLYEDFRRQMGFPAPPNFILTLGHAPAVAEGTWGLVQNVLVGGRLPRTLKEMMLLAVSHDRQCRYCEAAHTACCRMLGVDAATLEALVARMEDVQPQKARDVLLFAVQCARDPQSLRDADFDVLRRHGLAEPEILEIISMSALAVYANILADATGVRSDEMFSQL